MTQDSLMGQQQNLKLVSVILKYSHECCCFSFCTSVKRNRRYRRSNFPHARTRTKRFGAIAASARPSPCCTNSASRPSWTRTRRRRRASRSSTRPAASRPRPPACSGSFRAWKASAATNSTRQVSCEFQVPLSQIPSPWSVFPISIMTVLPIYGALSKRKSIASYLAQKCRWGKCNKERNFPRRWEVYWQVRTKRNRNRLFKERLS